jgi:hypothetical protein
VTALVRADSNGRAWVALLEPAARLARDVAPTQFVPGNLRDNPAAVAAAILYGDEVGLGPMQSIAKIAVIDGRPYVAAESLRALVLAAGHDIWPEESTNARVTWCGKRAGSDQLTRITWTMDDARKAHLDGKPNWRSYPRAMLSARASTELIRAVFADVAAGLGALEEYDDAFDTQVADPVREGSAPVDAAGRRRRSRRPARPAVVPAPEAASPPPQAATAIGLPARPPLPGEPGAPGTPLPPPEMTDDQRKLMMRLFRELNVDRADRLRIVSDWIGRRIGTAKELTRAEASLVLDRLAEWARPPDDEPEPEPEPGDVEGPPVEDVEPDGHLL